MRFLVVIFTWLLVFAAICFSVSAETPEQAEEHQEGSHGVNSPSNAEGVEGSLDDPLPEEVEQRISEKIVKVSKESQRRERSGESFLFSFGYVGHGIDEMLPEQFFRGSMISLGYSFLHHSGFRLGVKQFSAPDGGGWFDSLEDRMVLDASFQKEFGPLYGSVRHRWVHIHHRAREDFFYADRHRTSLQGGISLGPLNLYAFTSSDIPAHVPVTEMTVYGGGGFDLRGRFSSRNAEFYLGASAVSSLFLYNHQDERALYRVCAGFTVGDHDYHKVIFNPEIRFFKGVYSTDNLWVASFKLIF